MADLRQDKLKRAVQSLLILENTIAASLAALEETVSSGLPDGYADTVNAHRQALDDYLGQAGGDTVVAAAEPDAATAAIFGGATVAGARSSAVTALYGQLSYAVMRYAAVFEMSLKLHDQRLRDLAPRHMDDHKSGAYSLAAHCAEIVAAELAADGLECQCVCPMCSLGACGCVSMGHGVAVSPLARPDSVMAESGFLLEQPRAGSQLAAARVVAGDRLLAIDDQAVTELLDIQTAIRRHQIGERLQLLISRGDSTRQIEVTHVGDY